MNRTLLLALSLVMTISSVVFGTTAISRTINLTNSDAAAAGFTADELLVSPFSTLNSGYSNSFNIDMFVYNNHCEATNDVPAEWYDESGSRELKAFWLTWDSTNLYLAVQADVIGAFNEVQVLIDTAPATGITNLTAPPDYTSPKVEEINLHTEGFSPNMVIRMECDEYSPAYYGTPVFGTTYMQLRLVSGTWINTNMQTLGSGFYAWYNSGSQTIASERLFMARIPWPMIFATVSSSNSLTLKLAVFSTGPFSEDPASVFDAIPQGSSATPPDAGLYVQDNWLSVQVTDASGDILTGISPRDTASVAFYPGSRKTPPLERPILLSPVNGAVISTNSINLEWESAAKDAKQQVSYRLFLGTNASFDGGTGVTGQLLTRKPAPSMMMMAILLLAGIPLSIRKKARLLILALIVLAGVLACGDDPDPAPPATADQEYALTGLVSGRTYYWKIRATDIEGYYIDSETHTFTTAF